MLSLRDDLSDAELNRHLAKAGFAFDRDTVAEVRRGLPLLRQIQSVLRIEFDYGATVLPGTSLGSDRDD